MSKPDDIPQDVWQAARGARLQFHHDDRRPLPPWPLLDRIIARAILAERERCYNIANGEMRNVMQLLSSPPKSDAAWTIANRIKSGTQ